MAGPRKLMLLINTVKAILRGATMNQKRGKKKNEGGKLWNELELI